MAVINLNGQYQLDADAALVSQDIANNRSLIYARTIIHKLSGSGYWDNVARSSGQADVLFNNAWGTVWANGGFTYDFRNGSSSGSWTYTDGSYWVNHSPDGTGQYAYSASFNLYDIGSGSVGTGVRALPRIPRGPRIKHSGVFKPSLAMVKHGGVWKIAIPYVKNAGVWKIGGG